MKTDITSTDKEPEPSISSFLKRRASRRSSYASTVILLSHLIRMRILLARSQRPNPKIPFSLIKKLRKQLERLGQQVAFTSLPHIHRFRGIDQKREKTETLWACWPYKNRFRRNDSPYSNTSMMWRSFFRMKDINMEWTFGNNADLWIKTANAKWRLTSCLALSCGDATR